jgi:Holliday junction resolvase RusA-like endonuclease
MSRLSPNEVERALIRRGVPALMARTAAFLGSEEPTPAASEELDGPSIEWPVRLILPWSYLISDNRKYGVIEGKLILTKDYRRCKGLIHDAAKTKLAGALPVAIPLSLEARVWVPDDIKAHDVCNFAKAAHDALEGVVYTKDRWLHDVRWIRAGVDVDGPRAELRIAPLQSSPAT